jgi:hypothetical protein
VQAEVINGGYTKVCCPRTRARGFDPVTAPLSTPRWQRREVIAVMGGVKNASTSSRPA